VEEDRSATAGLRVAQCHSGRSRSSSGLRGSHSCVIGGSLSQSRPKVERFRLLRRLLRRPQLVVEQCLFSRPCRASSAPGRIHTSTRTLSNWLAGGGGFLGWRHSVQQLGLVVRRLTHTVRTRRLAIALGPQLIALIARSTDSPSHRPCCCRDAARSIVKQCLSLTAGRGGQGPIAEWHTMRLHHGLAIGQDMAIGLEVVQSVLGRVGERVERRRAHVLLEVLFVRHHVWGGQMAEARRVLMHTGRQHGC
jgi:hypothetical protein